MTEEPKLKDIEQGDATLDVRSTPPVKPAVKDDADTAKPQKAQQGKADTPAAGSEQGAAKQSQKAAGKAGNTAGETAGAKTPDKSPDKTSDKSPDKTPAKTQGKTLAKAAAKTPEKPADKTPQKTGQTSPAQKQQTPPQQARQGGGQGGGKGGGQGGGAAWQQPAPQIIEVKPLAQPARMKRRHWGLVFSFFLLVLAPLGAMIFYLWFMAKDQYASTTGFTVRQEEGAAATDLLGGLTQFAGGGPNGDGDILYEFIQSQGLVTSIDDKLDLKAHYAQHWPDDWLFSLWPDATAEDLLWYWQRMVQISFDQATGLMEVRVLAFDAAYAQTVARQIVAESQAMINALNTQAREDAMRYARADLEEAIARLKRAREALTQFRTRTQIVDPAADIQSRMGVMANLQQQLAEALIEYDLLRQTVGPSDPRVTQALRMISVIRERIAIERQTFTSDSTDTGAVGEDYPTLIAEFESLSVDRVFAEESYRAALTAVDVAKAEAARQSRYLATYIKPTLATESQYPARYMLSGLAALFLLLVWSIIALIYYSLRDRR